MLEVIDSIVIGAPIQCVWNVTIAVENWPLWCPTVRELQRLDSGPFELGSRARIRQPMQPESVWTVTAFESGRCFHWETRRRGLRMIGSHQVQQTADGTLNHLGLLAEGPLATLLGPIFRIVVRSALRQENEALKMHCERHCGQA